jgi:hypothetical protein
VRSSGNTDDRLETGERATATAGVYVLTSTVALSTQRVKELAAVSAFDEVAALADKIETKGTVGVDLLLRRVVHVVTRKV